MRSTAPSVDVTIPITMQIAASNVSTRTVQMDTVIMMDFALVMRGL
jgi:hypothetical protein